MGGASFVKTIINIDGDGFNIYGSEPNDYGGDIMFTISTFNNSERGEQTFSGGYNDVQGAQTAISQLGNLISKWLKKNNYSNTQFLGLDSDYRTWPNLETATELPK